MYVCVYMNLVFFFILDPWYTNNYTHYIITEIAASRFQMSEKTAKLFSRYLNTQWAKRKNEWLFNSTITSHTQTHTKFWEETIHFVISFGIWNEVKKTKRWRRMKRKKIRVHTNEWWRRLDLTDKYKKYIYNYVNDFQLGISRLHNCLYRFVYIFMRNARAHCLFWIMNVALHPHALCQPNSSCNLPLYSWMEHDVSVRYSIYSSFLVGFFCLSQLFPIQCEFIEQQ